jgi:hypothetical protein
MKHTAHASQPHNYSQIVLFSKVFVNALHFTLSNNLVSSIQDAQDGHIHAIKDMGREVVKLERHNIY